jgi:hypothetical protein
MIRYLGPMMFLGVGLYLYQNVGQDITQYMVFPLIEHLPGVGPTIQERQRATAYAFIAIGVITIFRKLLHKSGSMDSGMGS